MSESPGDKYGGWDEVSYPQAVIFYSVILSIYGRILTWNKIMTKLELMLKSQYITFLMQNLHLTFKIKFWKKWYKINKKGHVNLKECDFFYTTIKIMLEQNLNNLYQNRTVFSEQPNIFVFTKRFVLM